MHHIDYSVSNKMRQKQLEFICLRVKCGKLTGTDNQEKTDKGKCARGFNASFKEICHPKFIAGMWADWGQVRGQIFHESKLRVKQKHKIPASQCDLLVRLSFYVPEKFGNYHNGLCVLLKMSSKTCE